MMGKSNLKSISQTQKIRSKWPIFSQNKSECHFFPNFEWASDFYPISIFDHTQMINSTRIEWCEHLSSISVSLIVQLVVLRSPIFCSVASHWQNCTLGPKTILKWWEHVSRPSPHQQLKIMFSKLKVLDPSLFKEHGSKNRK